MYPKSTPLPDEEPPKPEYGRHDNEGGGDTVPDHGLVGEYSDNVLHQQEHNGAAYRLKHLRSAPQQEYGSSTVQGRLYRAAVPYSDQRVSEVPQAFTEAPNGESLRFANMRPDGPTSDAQAMRMRVQPPPHPVYFGRGRAAESHPQVTNFKQEPDEQAAATANGRTIYGGPHRTDARY